MTRTYIYIAIGILFFSFEGKTQNSKNLKIGDKMPTAMWETITKNQKAEIVLLDFWTTYCSSCIAAFPKMELLQKDFENRLQVVLVNSMESESKIKARFNKINANRHNPIEIPSSLMTIYGNKQLIEYFPHHSVPHYVLLNKEGKVLAITNGGSITSANIEIALKKGQLNLLIKDDLAARDLTENGLIRSRSSVLHPMYYSVFMNYDPSAQIENLKYREDSIRNTFKVSMRGMGIVLLFKQAYATLVNLPARMIIELDKEIFVIPKSLDLKMEWLKKYCFSYEFLGSLKSKENWRETMRYDLNRFLGEYYEIEGVIEKRKFNCLILVRGNDKLLKTSITRKRYQAEDSFYKWENYPVKEMVKTMQRIFEDSLSKRFFIDETNLDANIDMKIPRSLSNREKARQQVQQYGLDIIEEEREVEVLVIRNKKTDPGLVKIK